MSYIYLVKHFFFFFNFQTTTGFVCSFTLRLANNRV